MYVGSFIQLALLIVLFARIIKLLFLLCSFF